MQLCALLGLKEHYIYTKSDNLGLRQTIVYLTALVSYTFHGKENVVLWLIGAMSLAFDMPTHCAKTSYKVVMTR